MKRIGFSQLATLTLFLSLLVLPVANAQTVESYLPEATRYNPNIPKPEQVIGHFVGEWHVTHDKLVAYMKAVDEASDRVTLQEIGKTHEARPILRLTITSPQNHRNLERIKERHQQLLDPAVSGRLSLEEMPVVISMNYSIHGNEPSGSNASMAVLYYLASAQGEEIEKMLSESVILFDPSLNPDGLNRFATWVNMHKGATPNGDPAHREFSEVWPGGRTNHYWFDMNRDWLPVQQPESRARIRAYQEFRPNVLTDHHEMGTNSTFFFQPGIPSRTNPLTLQRNQQLTAAIAEYHAQYLDAIGSLYYSEESFDDFYYGKGSTYPDVQGTIGILFEQGSSRGHLQESVNGPVSFPFTIRNQVETSLSTWKASTELRLDLLDHMRTSISEQRELALESGVSGYIVGSSQDKSTTWHFADILDHHNIEFAPLASSITRDGLTFEQGEAWVIPLDQPQARLIQGMFDRSTTFTDSLFYDVSAWTLPYAMNLPFVEIGSRESARSLMSSSRTLPAKPTGEVVGTQDSNYWVFEWDDYYAPKLLYQLQEAGIVARVATRPFSSLTSQGLKEFDFGTIVISSKNQSMGLAALYRSLRTATASAAVTIYGLETGLTPSGIDLGSPNVFVLQKPAVAVLVGPGASSSEAGEAWHLLDNRFGIPVTLIESDDVPRRDLSRYTTIVLPSGGYGGADGAIAQNLKEWVRAGGTLITLRGATQWAQQAGLLSTKTLRRNRDTAGEESGQQVQKSYIQASEESGSRAMGGSIFFGNVDLTHPIAYGLNRSVMPLFKNSTQLIEPTQNPFAAPIVYTNEPLAAGYVHPEFLEQIPGKPAIVVGGEGAGTVIGFVDNPNFRAFWYGTNKLFLNAIYFGDTISRATKE